MLCRFVSLLHLFQMHNVSVIHKHSLRVIIPAGTWNVLRQQDVSCNCAHDSFASRKTDSRTLRWYTKAPRSLARAWFTIAPSLLARAGLLISFEIQKDGESWRHMLICSALESVEFLTPVVFCQTSWFLWWAAVMLRDYCGNTSCNDFGYVINVGPLKPFAE